MNAPLQALAFNPQQAIQQVSEHWDQDLVKQISQYIEIPAKSPMFDADWAQSGFIDTVVRNAAAWVEAQKIEGLKLEVVRLEGRTPVIFFEIDGTKSGSTDTVLMYGHLDKQPEFSGWRNDLGPWTAKLENDKLYGRGSADDGYSIYAAISAIAALKTQNTPIQKLWVW